MTMASSSFEERFGRTRLLLGTEALDRLRRARVVILGLGGVGAFAAEAAARAGIGSLTLVDGDTVEPSNCNRQLPALTTAFGRPKAEVVAERLRQINPELMLSVRIQFLEGTAIGALLDEGFDYAIDAIDSLRPKIDFILECRARRIPLISSMGSGGKLDPARIEIGDISRTHGCALARAVRSGLRDRGVYRGVRTVFSPEEVPKTAVHSMVDAAGKRRTTVGTISYMPALFGEFCASVAIRDLTAKNGHGILMENTTTSETDAKG